MDELRKATLAMSQQLCVVSAEASEKDTQMQHLEQSVQAYRLRVEELETTNVGGTCAYHIVLTAVTTIYALELVMTGVGYSGVVLVFLVFASVQ